MQKLAIITLILVILIHGLSLKPHPHEQFLNDNFSVANVFARVHGTTNDIGVNPLAPEITLTSGDMHDNKARTQSAAKMVEGKQE